MYNFVDPTSLTASSSTLCSEALTIDGDYIENNVMGYTTLSVSGRESLNYDIADSDRPIGVDGQDYFGKRLPARKIVITFRLEAESADMFMANYRALKRFCSGKDRVLRFADEPSAHYNGTLINLDAPDSGMLRVVSEMTWYCADPYLVDDDVTTVTASAVNGILTATIDNYGSAPIFPTYKITHNSENGYIGIVHSGGAFEMGNRDEADTTTYTKSERLLSGFSAFTAYTGTNKQDSAITLNGTLKLNGDWLQADSLGSGSYWHGGCMRAALPADSNGEVGAKNFYCWWESRFMTGAIGQTGFSQVVLTDENDAFIASFNTNKSDMSGNSASVNILVPVTGIYRTFTITPSVYEENPYRYDHGAEDILKEGSKLRFYFCGKYYSIDVPSIADKKVTYIYIVIGQYGTSSKYITVNQIGKFSATKNMVEQQKDIPNRYAAGSEVVVDTSDDSIMIDGLPHNDELVTGSEFAPLPVGTTAVEFYPSSWCTAAPTVTVEYRKRWL